jgi:hypothetical protein
MPMYGPVDRLWHVFLTFTRDYAAFCQAVAGRFIHHRPEAQGAGSQHETRRFVRL